jgi:O-antigen/teichoic acid export membrane protein
MRNFSRFGKNMFEPLLLGSGNLIASVIGALFWLVLASIVTVTSYGELNYYIAAATLASVLSLAGVNFTTMTYLAKGFEKILGQANVLVLILSSFSAIILVTITNNISAALLVLASSTFAMTYAEFLGRKNYKGYSILIIVNRAAQVLVSLGLYYFLGINGIILGYVLAYLVLSYPFFRSIKSATLSFEEIRQKISFSLHSYSISVSQAIATYADKLLIAPIFGFEMLGLYQLGFQFLMFLAFIPSSLYQYLLPQEASGIERKGVRRIGLVISIVFAVTLFFTLPLVIERFFPKYTEATSVAQVMILGVIPLTISSLINSRLLGMAKSKPVLIGSATYVSSLLILLYLLGSHFGLLGLGMATIISSSIQCAFLWIINNIHKKSDSH